MRVDLKVDTHAYGAVDTHAYGAVGTHAYGAVGTHDYGAVGTHDYGAVGTHDFGAVGTHDYGAVGTHDCGSVDTQDRPATYTGGAARPRGRGLPTMIPWQTLGEALTPDGTRITLRQRGHEFLLLADGRSLMPSTITGSEQALALVGCRHLASTPRPRVLIGGLGLGFTARAALDLLPADASLVIAELVPEVRAWNEQLVGHLAGHPLADPRVTVTIGDALAVIRAERDGLDAILLDVDNGPAEFAARGNDALYGAAGLASMRQRLRPGGVLAVWSAWEDHRFARRLTSAGFAVTLERVRGHGRRGARHLIYRALPRR
ncbi:hypothetical protein TBR22_A23090 [Luteitalea sp. TBR-22]|uniref:spermidine synthase n=1 Tax=Luteitalea sp. TBR-22 TaxID=2802971 RepID=UPI001AFBD6D5|nr:MnmC family methyltransferase [Luteitalea sp. TBR-22]BCS33083.1 hypothetical protein TBR22_A23090 [Luteitalea sp. TBR-22]